MKPCIPDILPLKESKLDWKALLPHISRATQAIARYNGGLEIMGSTSVLLSPITSQEAVSSLRIEGTQVSLTEVFQHVAGKDYGEGKKNEIQEILNYRKALLTAEDYCQEKPISLFLIRELHKVLMSDVRGGDKTPGVFRTSQNWIGSPGCLLEQARFVPPDFVHLASALDNFQAFLESDFPDPLVQLAILHAQFEILHPFHDGNGRLGRILIPLFLFYKEILTRPMFYLSEYLEERDTEYRNRLLDITEQGSWHEWVLFFLNAIEVQAKRNTRKIQEISGLYHRLKTDFIEASHSALSLSVLDTFFYHPVLNTRFLSQKANIHNRSTLNHLLRQLKDRGLIELVRESSGRRPAIYILPELITLAERKEPL